MFISDNALNCVSIIIVVAQRRKIQFNESLKKCYGIVVEKLSVKQAVFDSARN